MSDEEMSDTDDFEGHYIDIVEIPGTLHPGGILQYNYRVQERRPLPQRLVENTLLRDSDLVVPPSIAPATYYDQNLTPAHQYLGRGLQETTGRTIFEEGVIYTLPVIYLKLNLIPGQILPMIARTPSIKQLLRHVVSAKNRVFGVSYTHNFNKPISGTIAEIYEHSVDILTAESFQIKAMGHQRFTILSTEPFHGCFESEIVVAQVKILADVTLTNPFNSLCLHPKKRNPSHKEMCRKRDMWQTQWPDWVYKQFDVHQLAERVSKKINMWYKDVKIPDDPSLLSLQVIRLGMFKPEQVNCLLGIESTNLRLQFELQYWDENQSMQKFLCSRPGCGLPICSMSNVFPMSPAGPQGTYCNSFGQIHDLITVTELDEEIDVLSIGQPSTECCWFPGYKWLIILCPNCQHHLGWRYEADNDRSLVPRLFYGLSMRGITSIKDYLPSNNNPRNLDYVDEVPCWFSPPPCRNVTLSATQVNYQL